ncbi:hypothetical protein CISIN_1g013647mg [Citrus sinensis]|uniref:DUF1308 domain-containing protein n=1 Tax=Citrus sinensis TaxID=2711 RepID=A0A067EYC1_CITSI|nr:hypothetical protein CISIN_1g013647mg [Citrus sinensis]KDO55961.1 hypothetical protein CISIN_1g013647mg [Citrus sinensis]
MEEIEALKQRCKGVIKRIEKLPSSTKIPESCKKTLFKLANSELNYLSRLSSPIPVSSNIGHLESVVYILQQPFITGVSRVCKSIKNGFKSVHVDIICTLYKTPLWIIVSDRNPRYVSWDGSDKGKGLKLRVEEVLAAAVSSPSLKPCSVVLFFSNGVGEFVNDRLISEYGAAEFNLSDFEFFEEVEDGWVNVLSRLFRDACMLEIKLNFCGSAASSSECGVKRSIGDVPGFTLQEKNKKVSLGGAFGSLLSQMKFCCEVELDHLLNEGNLINFDTTALIALVSGISNGCAEKFLATPDIELRQRFKGNTQFVIAQALSEIQTPIDKELGGVIAGKKGIICESVLSEFKELVSMCGGPNEKLRADELLKCLMSMN